jgi:hypothetical protein
MMRLISLIMLYCALVASSAFGQTVFTPSPIDFKQNERLDELEKQIGRLDVIDSELYDIKETQSKILTKLDEVKPDTVVQTPKPKVAVKLVSQPVSNGLYTEAELRAIYNKEWPIGYSVRNADVSPRSAVWNHLTSGVHGFQSSQVQGLTQSEALGIQDLHHAGLIRAQKGSYRKDVTVAAKTIKPSVSQPVFSSGCANGQCARQPVQRSFRIFRR